MTRPERIAVVTSSYPASPGDPAGHFVRAEAHALAREGHAVTVFAPGKTSESVRLVREVRIADGGASGWPGLLPRLGARPWRAFGLSHWALGVRRELELRGPFQRVVAHFLLPTAFPTLFALDLGRAALEVVVHGTDARLLSRLPRPASRRILNHFLERGASFRCVSHELVLHLEAALGEPLGERVRVAPAALELDGVPSRAAARALLGISPEARLVVSVGRLIPGKRTRTALAAAALLDPLELVVIGDGPQLAELTRAFPRARFTGRVERPRALAWIAAADAVISGSMLEGSPSVVREARALGVPVVARDSGDLRLAAADDPDLYVVAD